MREHSAAVLQDLGNGVETMRVAPHVGGQAWQSEVVTVVLRGDTVVDLLVVGGLGIGVQVVVLQQPRLEHVAQFVDLAAGQRGFFFKQRRARRAIGVPAGGGDLRCGAVQRVKQDVGLGRMGTNAPFHPRLPAPGSGELEFVVLLVVFELRVWRREHGLNELVVNGIRYPS